MMSKIQIVDNELVDQITHFGYYDMELSIYDLEKTVCDVLRQRNKLGMEMVRDVLDTYLRRPDRNLARLVE